MNTGILDNLNEKCANCGEMDDQMLKAELRTGTQTFSSNAYSSYQVNDAVIEIGICKDCVLKKRRKQWLGYSILALVSAILISVDLLDGQFSILGAFGMMEGGVLLIVLPKMTYKTIDFCDEVAQKHFRKNLPEEVRKDKKFRVFTRLEIKKMSL